MSSIITPPPADKIGENHIWRDWFVKLQRFVMPSRNDILPSAISPGASPYTYRNTNSYPINVIIQGGTVSSITFSRDNITNYNTGITTGIVTLSSGDYLTVTYTVAPTMTQIPL